MRNPSTFCGRRRAATLCLVAACGMVLTSCAPSQRLYARTPRTSEDAPIPWGRVDIVSFEDDTRRKLLPEETLTLTDGELVVHGGTESEVIVLANVEAVRLEPVDGVSEWLEILTIDDMQRFDRLPPIQRIDLRDGGQWSRDPESAVRAAWSDERLGIVLRTGVDDPDAREILLDEIASIELLEDESLLQIVRSPRLWIVTAAALGAIILIGRGRGDRDSNATS